MAAGFEGFEITWSEDVFKGAPRPRKEIAEFGTRGVNFRARKPAYHHVGFPERLQRAHNQPVYRDAVHRRLPINDAILPLVDAR